MKSEVFEDLVKVNKTRQLESTLMMEMDFPLYLQVSSCQFCGAMPGVECGRECSRWLEGVFLEGVFYVAAYCCTWNEFNLNEWRF